MDLNLRRWKAIVSHSESIMRLNESDSQLTFEWDVKDEILEIHGTIFGLKKCSFND